MVEIIFKDNRIQTGFRVKIPKAVIDTLNLKVRDKIILKLDVEKGKITIEEEKKSKKQNG